MITHGQYPDTGCVHGGCTLCGQPFAHDENIRIVDGNARHAHCTMTAATNEPVSITVWDSLSNLPPTSPRPRGGTTDSRDPRAVIARRRARTRAARAARRKARR